MRISKDDGERGGIGIGLAVAGVCLAVLLLAIGLSIVNDAEGTDPATGFPIALVVLAVVSALVAAVWWALDRKRRQRQGRR